MEGEVLILPIEICRICTNLNPNLDILTNKLEDENVLLHEALEFVSCIRIDFDDGMSRTMCLTCCKKLLDAYRFKNQILDSYRAFYNQTSDVSFKKDHVKHEDESGKVVIATNNTIDSKLKPEPALVIERANELGIQLSTDAVSFILEQNSYKAKGKRKPSLALENLVADEQIVEELDTGTEEDDGVDIDCAPSIRMEAAPIEHTQENTHSANVETPSIEDNQVHYSEPPPLEQTDTEIQPTPNSRPPERKLRASNKDNSKCSATRSNKAQKSKLTCHICHKTFPKKSNLRDHLRLHANEKNFVCSFCQKAFVQVANYRTHLRVHTKERPYHCHLCPKTYTQAGSLNTHIRSHTNERNYVCEVCCKDFTNSSDLGKHKRIHDQSSHFACGTCGKRFTQKVNLKAHEKNVHYITEK